MVYVHDITESPFSVGRINDYYYVLVDNDNEVIKLYVRH